MMLKIFFKHRSSYFVGATVIAWALAGPSPAGPGVMHAQAPAPRTAPGAIAPAESAAIAQGWALLVQGNLAGADGAAREVLRLYPLNPSSIALAVEAAMARQGWRAGLDTYDQWVGARSVDNLYAIRRIARSVLFEALTTSVDADLQLDVVNALALDGENVQMLLQNTQGPAGADPRARAAAGDPKAIAALAAGIDNEGDRVGAIKALGRSRNAAAIAPLVGMLGHQRSELRAAAAAGLGDLNARNAVPQLRQMLKDEQLLPRMAAAGSLMRLGDTSAATLVREWLSSDVADVRLEAARITASNPDGSWTAHVRQLLQDPDPMIRIGAARLLGEQDPSTARWALQSLTNDSNLAIREEALRVMPEVVGGDFAELRRFLRAADADIRIRAALRIVQLTR